jgi:hypothetical protein
LHHRPAAVGPSLLRDHDERQPSPHLAREALAAQVPGNEVQVDVRDLRPRVVAHCIQAGADDLVARVVGDDERGSDRRRAQQSLDVAPDPLRGVIAVDEREVDVAALGVKRARSSGSRTCESPVWRCT